MSSQSPDASPVQLPMERFSDAARQVLVRAEEEARRLNHNYMGTEHLLLGLLSQGDSLAVTVLRDLGVALERVRAIVEHIIGLGESAVVGEIHMTPRAVTAVSLGASESYKMRHDHVGPEHLLLGLVREGEGIAAGALESLGLRLETVRAQTIIAIAAVAAPKIATTQASATKSNVVTCRIGDRDLDALDALVEAGIRSTRSDAAAWLIHAGIEANKPLLEKVYGTVAEIRRLREVAQGLAQQAMEGHTQTDPEGQPA